MKTLARLLALVAFATAAHADNTSTISRLQLDHPTLGHTGGAALHTHITTLNTKVGNNVSSRYAEYTAVANGAVTTYEHNLGEPFAEMTVVLWSGTGSSKTRITDPAGSGWTIAATGGFTTTKIDITAPGSGGPHDFSVELYSGMRQIPAAGEAADELLSTNGSGAYSWIKVFNANVDASAAISRSKLASGTASHVVVNDGSGVMSSEAQLAASRGGTGQDFSGSTGVAQVAAGVFSVSAIDLGTADVTGTLPIANGGTGQTSQTAAFNELDPLTTKGDLITHNGSDSIRRAVGTDGQALVADSAHASGLNWASAATVPAEGAVYSNGTALQTTGAFAGNANEVVGVNSGATATEYKALATGTSGTDFAIAHGVGTVTFNLPDAGASARGAVTTGTQTLAGAKTFSSAASFTAATNEFSSVDLTGSLSTGAIATGGTQANSAIAIHAQADAALIRMRRVDGTIGSPTGLTGSGDDISDIQFAGYDGDQFIVAAQISAETDSAPGDNDMPGRIVMYTTPDGTASGVERMRIQENGNVAFGGNGSGDANIGPTAATCATASYSFVGDLNTGVTSTGADAVDICSGGTSRFQVAGNLNYTVADNTLISLQSTDADAADNSELCMSAGGSCSDGRGANIRLWGNEFGSGDNGRLSVTAGNDSGNGSIDFRTSNDTRLGVSFVGAVHLGNPTSAGVPGFFVATQGSALTQTGSAFCAQEDGNWDMDTDSGECLMCWSAGGGFQPVGCSDVSSYQRRCMCVGVRE